MGGGWFSWVVVMCGGGGGIPSGSLLKVVLTSLILFKAVFRHLPVSNASPRISCSCTKAPHLPRAGFIRRSCSSPPLRFPPLFDTNLSSSSWSSLPPSPPSSPPSSPPPPPPPPPSPPPPAAHFLRMPLNALFVGCPHKYKRL